MCILVSQVPSGWCSKMRTVLPDTFIGSPVLTMTLSVQRAT